MLPIFKQALGLPRVRRVGFFTAISMLFLLSACGGGGGSSSISSGTTPNTVLATQIAEVQPDNEVETSSVFVQLGSPNSPVAGAQVSTDIYREQIQNQFLADLEAANKPKVLFGISTSAPCDATGLARQIENAHKFTTGTVVRLDLTACQLDLLKSIPNVRGVYPDILLDKQAIVAPLASHFENFNNAADFSFNGTNSRQINTSALGSGNPKSADGNGTVIAILDSGVDDQHLTLNGVKVVPGACFSTPSNGGASFCNSANVLIEASDNSDPSKRVARSCADATNSGTPVWSPRQLGITAGCSHGTAMAAASAMAIHPASSSTAHVLVRGGLAPRAKILPIQVFNRFGNAISASSSDILAALEWLSREADRRKKNGLEPIVAVNMSLGAGSYSGYCESIVKDDRFDLFTNVFAKLRAQGVLPIVAAGNLGSRNSISFPACIRNSVSVAATQLDGLNLAKYSNFSKQVKLLAIGGDDNGQYSLPTLCTDANNFDCWSSITGTSPAAALVSGGVAALSSLKPSATADEIENVLTSANGASSREVTFQDTKKPALRLTSSGYKLVGLTEPTPALPKPPVTAPSPAPATVATKGSVCFYPKTNYQGDPTCANFLYAGTNLWHVLFKKVGSIKVQPIDGIAPGSKAKVTYFHFAFDFIFNQRGVSSLENIPNTAALGFWAKDGIPRIFGIRIESP